MLPDRIATIGDITVASVQVEVASIVATAEVAATVFVGFDIVKLLQDGQIKKKVSQ